MTRTNTALDPDLVEFFKPRPAGSPGPVAAARRAQETPRELDVNPAADLTRKRESSWPYPAQPKVEMPVKQSGLLLLWSWLKKRVPNAPTKRLRLADNIQLGDKRFVALVTVDGREFLIGGAASSVSLLSQWDTPASQPVTDKRALRFEEPAE